MDLLSLAIGKKLGGGGGGSSVGYVPLNLTITGSEKQYSRVVGNSGFVLEIVDGHLSRFGPEEEPFSHQFALAYDDFEGEREIGTVINLDIEGEEGHSTFTVSLITDYPDNIQIELVSSEGYHYEYDLYVGYSGTIADCPTSLSATIVIEGGK